MQNYLYNLATDKTKGLIGGIIKVFLFILSIIYGLVVRFLIFFSRISPCRLNVKVISVGNITLGGTGKTSLVEFIARCLKEQGHKVAILSRGYKRLGSRSSVLGPRSSTVHCLPSTEIMGDEPYMLAKKLGDTPVIVDADRIKAGRRARKDYKVDTVILDDGFQQWRIAKDLEIVNIDVTNPFGNRHMLPRGILREPLSALRRADIFVLTKTNLTSNTDAIRDFLNKLNPKAMIIESVHQPIGFYHIDKQEDLLNPGILKGKTVTLFSGIGDPDSFANLIKSLGIKIGLSFRFPDHYRYSQKDLENISRQSQERNIDTIITTEKDAVRLYGLRVTGYGLRIFALSIRLKFTQNNEEGFYNRLLGLYSP